MSTTSIESISSDADSWHLVSKNPQPDTQPDPRKTLQDRSEYELSTNKSRPVDLSWEQCEYVLRAINDFIAEIPTLGLNDNPLWFVARIKRLQLFYWYPWLLHSASTVLPNQKFCVIELVCKIRGKMAKLLALQADLYRDLPTLFDFLTKLGEAMSNSTERPMNMTFPTRSAKESPMEFIFRAIEQFSLLMDVALKEENATSTKLAAWIIYDNLQRDYPHVLRENEGNARMFHSTVLGYRSLEALQNGLLRDWSRVPAVPPKYDEIRQNSKSPNKKNKRKPKARA